MFLLYQIWVIYITFIKILIFNTIRLNYIMKTVILAGGYGSRIPEYTNKIPKPMIKVGGVPLLTHIMRIFKSVSYTHLTLPTTPYV